jgi:hypothetical protein
LLLRKQARIEAFRQRIDVLTGKIQLVDPYYVQPTSLLGISYADITAGRSKSQERRSESREPKLETTETQVVETKIAPPVAPEPEPVTKAPRRSRSPRRRDDKPKPEPQLEEIKETPAVKLTEERLHLKPEPVQPRGRSPSPMWEPGSTTYAEILRGQYGAQPSEELAVPVGQEPEPQPLPEEKKEVPKAEPEPETVSVPQVQPQYNFIPAQQNWNQYSQTHYQYAIPTEQGFYPHQQGGIFDYIQPIPEMVNFIASGQQLMGSGLGTYLYPEQYSQHYQPTVITQVTHYENYRPPSVPAAAPVEEAPQLPPPRTEETDSSPKKEEAPVEGRVDAGGHFSYAQILSQGLAAKPLQPSSAAATTTNRQAPRRKSPTHGRESKLQDETKSTESQSHPVTKESLPDVVNKQQKKTQKKRYGRIDTREVPSDGHQGELVATMSDDDADESPSVQDLKSFSDVDSNVPQDTDKKRKSKKQKGKSDDDEIDKALKEIAIADQKTEGEEKASKKNKSHVKQITVVKTTTETVFENPKQKIIKETKVKTVTELPAEDKKAKSKKKKATKPADDVDKENVTVEEKTDQETKEEPVKKKRPYKKSDTVIEMTEVTSEEAPEGEEIPTKPKKKSRSKHKPSLEQPLRKDVEVEGSPVTTPEETEPKLEDKTKPKKKSRKSKPKEPAKTEDVKTVVDVLEAADIRSDEVSEAPAEEVETVASVPEEPKVEDVKSKSKKKAKKSKSKEEIQVVEQQVEDVIIVAKVEEEALEVEKQMLPDGETVVTPEEVETKVEDVKSKSKKRSKKPKQKSESETGEQKPEIKDETEVPEVVSDEIQKEGKSKKKHKKHKPKEDVISDFVEEKVEGNKESVESVTDAFITTEKTESEDVVVIKSKKKSKKSKSKEDISKTESSSETFIGVEKSVEIPSDTKIEVKEETEVVEKPKKKSKKSKPKDSEDVEKTTVPLEESKISEESRGFVSEVEETLVSPVETEVQKTASVTETVVVEQTDGRVEEQITTERTESVKKETEETVVTDIQESVTKETEESVSEIKDDLHEVIGEKVETTEEIISLQSTSEPFVIISEQIETVETETIPQEIEESAFEDVGVKSKRKSKKTKVQTDEFITKEKASGGEEPKPMTTDETVQKSKKKPKKGKSKEEIPIVSSSYIPVEESVEKQQLPEESDAKPSAEEVVEVETTKILPQDSLQTFINNEISHSIVTTSEKEVSIKEPEEIVPKAKDKKSKKKKQKKEETEGSTTVKKTKTTTTAVTSITKTPVITETVSLSKPIMSTQEIKSSASEEQREISDITKDVSQETTQTTESDVAIGPINKIVMITHEEVRMKPVVSLKMEFVETPIEATHFIEEGIHEDKTVAETTETDEEKLKQMEIKEVETSTTDDEKLIQKLSTTETTTTESTVVTSSTTKEQKTSAVTSETTVTTTEEETPTLTKSDSGIDTLSETWTTEAEFSEIFDTKSSEMQTPAETPLTEDFTFDAPESEAPLRIVTNATETVTTEKVSTEAAPLETTTLETTTVTEILPSETTVETLPAETISTETPITGALPTETPRTKTPPTETISIETTTTKTKPSETISTETPTLETMPTETSSTATARTKTPPAETVSIETTTTETLSNETLPPETISTETPTVETLPTETSSIATLPTETARDSFTDTFEVEQVIFGSVQERPSQKIAESQARKKKDKKKKASEPEQFTTEELEACKVFEEKLKKKKKRQGIPLEFLLESQPSTESSDKIKSPIDSPQTSTTRQESVDFEVSNIEDVMNVLSGKENVKIESGSVSEVEKERPEVQTLPVDTSEKSEERPKESVERVEPVSEGKPVYKGLPIDETIDILDTLEQPIVLSDEEVNDADTVKEKHKKKKKKSKATKEIEKPQTVEDTSAEVTTSVTESVTGVDVDETKSLSSWASIVGSKTPPQRVEEEPTVTELTAPKSETIIKEIDSKPDTEKKSKKKKNKKKQVESEEPFVEQPPPEESCPLKVENEPKVEQPEAETATEQIAEVVEEAEDSSKSKKKKSKKHKHKKEVDDAKVEEPQIDKPFIEEPQVEPGKKDKKKKRKEKFIVQEAELVEDKQEDSKPKRKTSKKEKTVSFEEHPQIISFEEETPVDETLSPSTSEITKLLESTSENLVGEEFIFIPNVMADNIVDLIPEKSPSEQLIEGEKKASVAEEQWVKLEKPSQEAKTDLWLDVVDETTVALDEEKQGVSEKESLVPKGESDDVVAVPEDSEKPTYKAIPRDDSKDIWIQVFEDDPNVFSEEDLEKVKLVRNEEYFVEPAEQKEIKQEIQESDAKEVEEKPEQKIVEIREEELIKDVPKPATALEEKPKEVDSAKEEISQQDQGLLLDDSSISIDKSTHNITLEFIEREKFVSEESVVPDEKEIEADKTPKVAKTEEKPQPQEKVVYKGLPIDASTDLWIDVLDEPMEFSDDEEIEKPTEEIKAVEKKEELQEPEEVTAVTAEDDKLTQEPTKLEPEKEETVTVVEESTKPVEKPAYKGLPLDQSSELWMDILDEPMVFSDDDDELPELVRTEEVQPAEQKVEEINQETKESQVKEVEDVVAAVVEKPEQKIVETKEEAKEKELIKGSPKVDDKVTHKVISEFIERERSIIEESPVKVEPVTEQQKIIEPEKVQKVEEKPEEKVAYKGLPVDATTDLWMDVLDEPMEFSDEEDVKRPEELKEKEVVSVQSVESKLAMPELIEKEKSVEKPEEKVAYKGLPIDASTDMWIDVLDEPMEFSDEEDEKQPEELGEKDVVSAQSVESKAATLEFIEKEKPTADSGKPAVPAYKGLPIDESSDLWMNVLDEEMVFSDEDTEQPVQQIEETTKPQTEEMKTQETVESKLITQDIEALKEDIKLEDSQKTSEVLETEKSLELPEVPTEEIVIEETYPIKILSADESLERIIHTPEFWSTDESEQKILSEVESESTILTDDESAPKQQPFIVEPDLLKYDVIGQRKAETEYYIDRSLEDKLPEETKEITVEEPDRNFLCAFVDDNITRYDIVSLMKAESDYYINTQQIEPEVKEDTNKSMEYLFLDFPKYDIIYLLNAEIAWYEQKAKVVEPEIVENVEESIPEEQKMKIEEEIVEEPREKVEAIITEEPKEKVEESITEKPKEKVEEIITEEPKLSQESKDILLEFISQEKLSSPVPQIDESVVLRSEPVTDLDEPVTDLDDPALDLPKMQEPEIVEDVITTDLDHPYAIQTEAVVSGTLQEQQTVSEEVITQKTEVVTEEDVIPAEISKEVVTQQSEKEPVLVHSDEEVEKEPQETESFVTQQIDEIVQPLDQPEHVEEVIEDEKSIVTVAVEEEPTVAVEEEPTVAVEEEPTVEVPAVTPKAEEVVEVSVEKVEKKAPPSRRPYEAPDEIPEVSLLELAEAEELILPCKDTKPSQFEAILAKATEFVPKLEQSRLNPNAAEFIPGSEQRTQYVEFTPEFKEEESEFDESSTQMWSYGERIYNDIVDSQQDSGFITSEPQSSVWAEEVTPQPREDTEKFIEAEKEDSSEKITEEKEDIESLLPKELVTEVSAEVEEQVTEESTKPKKSPKKRKGKSPRPPSKEGRVESSVPAPAPVNVWENLMKGDKTYAEVVATKLTSSESDDAECVKEPIEPKTEEVPPKPPVEIRVIEPSEVTVDYTTDKDGFKEFIPRRSRSRSRSKHRESEPQPQPLSEDESIDEKKSKRKSRRRHKSSTDDTEDKPVEVVETVEVKEQQEEEVVAVEEEKPVETTKKQKKKKKSKPVQDDVDKTETQEARPETTSDEVSDEGLQLKTYADVVTGRSRDASPVGFGDQHEEDVTTVDLQEEVKDVIEQDVAQEVVETEVVEKIVEELTPQVDAVKSKRKSRKRERSPNTSESSESFVFVQQEPEQIEATTETTKPTTEPQHKTYAKIVAASTRSREPSPTPIPTEVPKKPVEVHIQVVGEPEHKPEPLPVDEEGFMTMMTKKERRARSRSRSKTRSEPPKVDSHAFLENERQHETKMKSWASIVATKGEPRREVEVKPVEEERIVEAPRVEEIKTEIKPVKGKKKEKKEVPEKSSGIFGGFISSVKSVLGGSKSKESTPEATEKVHESVEHKKKKKHKKGKADKEVKSEDKGQEEVKREDKVQEEVKQVVTEVKPEDKAEEREEKQVSSEVIVTEEPKGEEIKSEEVVQQSVPEEIKSAPEVTVIEEIKDLGKVEEQRVLETSESESVFEKVEPEEVEKIQTGEEEISKVVDQEVKPEEKIVPHEDKVEEPETSTEDIAVFEMEKEVAVHEPTPDQDILVVEKETTPPKTEDIAISETVPHQVPHSSADKRLISEFIEREQSYTPDEPKTPESPVEKRGSFLNTLISKVTSPKSDDKKKKKSKKEETHVEEKPEGEGKGKKKKRKEKKGEKMHVETKDDDVKLPDDVKAKTDDTQAKSEDIKEVDVKTIEEEKEVESQIKDIRPESVEVKPDDIKLVDAFEKRFDAAFEMAVEEVELAKEKLTELTPSEEVKMVREEESKKKKKEKKTKRQKSSDSETGPEVEKHGVFETIVAKISEVFSHKKSDDLILSPEEVLAVNLNLDGPFWLDKSLYDEAEENYQLDLAKKKTAQAEDVAPSRSDDSPDKDRDRDSDSSSGRGSPRPSRQNGDIHGAAPPGEYRMYSLPGGVGGWKDRSTYLEPEPVAKIKTADEHLRAAKHLSESIAEDVIAESSQTPPLGPPMQPTISTGVVDRPPGGDNQLKKVKYCVFI